MLSLNDFNIKKCNDYKIFCYYAYWMHLIIYIYPFNFIPMLGMNLI